MPSEGSITFLDGPRRAPLVEQRPANRLRLLLPCPSGRRVPESHTLPSPEPSPLPSMHPWARVGASCSATQGPACVRTTSAGRPWRLYSKRGDKHSNTMGGGGMAAGSEQHPWRVLIVDDEENLNWSLVNSLRIEGYAADGVSTGLDAQQRLSVGRYDCVVSDVM